MRGLFAKECQGQRSKGGHCSRETHRLSEQELWPSVGTRGPAHQSAFCQELTWLRLVFKDHSDLSGTGCGQEVQSSRKEKVAACVSLVAIGKEKVVHPSSTILLSSRCAHGLSLVR